jgi:hypothetical protein
MIATKSLISAFAFAALAAAHGATPVRAGGAKELQVKPLKAINLDVGNKRAIGYYLADAGNCSLTVLLSDVNYQDDGTTPSASRVSVSVLGGTSAKVDTIDGTTMAFTCANGASTMGVSVFERIAQSPYLPRTVSK